MVSGQRPARKVPDGEIAQAKLKAKAVQQQAEQAGLAQLRKYIAGQRIVLYVHAESEVVLLALKHQRQLVYSAGSDD